MILNFITNQDINITSGGWSGINSNIYTYLKEYFNIQFIGPISPPSDKVEKTISKTKRIFGLPGNFHFFSDKRLLSIANEVKAYLVKSDYNFFFGQTPWIKCNYDIPYGTYMDAAFPTYLDIYLRPQKFDKNDVLRIAKIEEKWLQNANHIFIGSQWAWDEMIKHYDLDEKKKVVAWTGGNVPLPEKDNYNNGLNLVFISLNFEKKGGPICIKVLESLRKVNSHITLTIIGERPPEKYFSVPGLIYKGFLNKKDPNDLQVLQKILAEAFLLIHPTIMDTMGAVLIEAGYYGCPSIAPESFGIPELVLNKKTGIIVPKPFSFKDFESSIFRLIENKETYFEMRKNVWNYTHENLTWEKITKKIADSIISLD